VFGRHGVFPPLFLKNEILRLPGIETGFDNLLTMNPPASAKLYRTIGLRLLPILFVAYLINFLDRVNIGFANLSMSASLGMDSAAYGFGAGLFFIGYFLFEVPSNLALYRFGARIWITRIVFSWGILTTLTAFITLPWQFYTLRFLLGAAEAGFFPGIVLYLTWWYPSAMRARILAIFLSAIAATGILGGPVSGMILSSSQGWLGMADWQWLFLLEGTPCFLVAAWIFFALPNKPADAPWLDAESKRFVEDELRAEENERHRMGAPESALSGLCQPTVWKLCAIYFCQAMGLYGITFWLPEVVKELGWKSPLQIGFITAIPWTIAVVLMLVFSAISDRTGARRVPAMVAAVMGAAGFFLCLAFENPFADLAAISFAAGGVLSLIAISWSFPAALLSGAAAASGIALINSVGNLGGFCSPTLIGLLEKRTGNLDNGMLLTGAFLTLAGILYYAFRSLEPPASRAMGKSGDPTVSQPIP